ncbi:LuxR family transcriptional regulator [Pseudoduganella sp. FT55W]|uniref:LuxR family transcriptional regulator n=1 Tax=Duganella rivi TaxID=2666083 RepID=A0A7X4GLQ9_9BURK|nr:HD domain-containing phosphohydrolase [Duganella rivi]MYM65788.1 LuxR family transcriptional regulator [Duganella rivi]
MYPETTATIADAMRTLAYIGDLSMGQPTEHSLRTAWLAARITEAMHGCGDRCVAVQQVALLRWSGCTANAPEFSALIGDDVAGRAKMLSQRPDPQFAQVAERLYREIHPLAAIHCEVSGEIAVMLQVPGDVEKALRTIFSTYDGHGPSSQPQAEVPDSVYIVALASDIEILGREQGLDTALEIIARKSGKTYPQELASIAERHAGAWLELLDHGDDWQAALDFAPASGSAAVSLELLADVIDLKLPWMTGYSRRVAQAAFDGAAQLGLDADTQLRCYRAALVHGIGRAAIPNAVWNTSGRLSPGAREQMRLASYWTSRAATRIGALGDAANIGSYTGERLDGSGAFRGCTLAAIPLEGQVVAAAAAWVALQSLRPWRAAMSEDEARALLKQEAAAGRFGEAVVRAVTGASPAAAEAQDKILLTEREIEIFRRISLGLTNKEVARVLAISPSTVRTHVENVFRKLGCNTRAAATLKASTLRLI